MNKSQWEQGAIQPNAVLLDSSYIYQKVTHARWKVPWKHHGSLQLTYIHCYKRWAQTSGEFSTVDSLDHLKCWPGSIVPRPTEKDANTKQQETYGNFAINFAHKTARPTNARGSDSARFLPTHNALSERISNQPTLTAYR